MMRLGIDLDDTITDSSDVYVKYARKYNKEKSISHKININVMNQKIAFGWDEKNKEEFNNLYLSKILMEANPNEEAKKVLKKIHDNGHQIIIMTARNTREVKNVKELTKEWLSINNILYDEIIFDCKEKGEVALKYKIDVFIDNDINSCISVYDKLKIPVFLYATRYNQSEKAIGVYKFSEWSCLSSKAIINTPLQYIDVNNKSDFPALNHNKRYIHFYGGTKNYRAYIASSDMSRADFMELYPEYVPFQNQPIYENNGIIVRADPKYPCPGFYIFALNKTYRAFDLLDDVTFLRFSFILKKIKEGMRSELNINYAHLLSNEKSDPFVNVHFWLVPINGITSPDLLDFDVKEYLESFKPENEVMKILNYNEKLKEYIESIDLVKQDNELTRKLIGK